YLKGDPRLGRFYSYLLSFMAAMLGLVLADDLILLFVFWELTSISSYLLIGFNHETEVSRGSALKALLVTGSGGLALLAGILLLGIAHSQAGAPLEETWRISALAGADLRGHGLYTGALLLILLGAFTKSAQFPFHFWLPAAMAAPTPVSAFLHSATMVKAGIYLLARLHPALGGTEVWQITVTSFGGVTMLIGAIAAACQTDLKRLLAFSTISVLGTLVMLLGLGTELSIKAAVVLLAAHALYKASLFMVAGNIDHETGTRDVTKLGGLLRLMPLTAVAGMLAALSNAGAPPMFGFLGKEMLYGAKLELDRPLIIMAVVANVFLTATALVVAVKPFFGERKKTPKAPHEAPWTMLVGPVLLAAIGLTVGLVSGKFDLEIGGPVASAIAGRDVPMKLKLWHGVNPEALSVLGLSAFTLGAGFFLFLRIRTRLARFAETYRRIETTWGMPAMYERGLSAISASAKAVTRLVQSGYLRRYVLVAVLGIVVLVSVPLVRTHQPLGKASLFEIRIHELALALLILGGAVAAVISRSRMAAIVSLGVTGLGVTMVFALFSAPDLAITQILVETLTVILFVLVFWRLPRYSFKESLPVRARDLVVAVAAGGVLCLLVLAAASVQLDPETARGYAEASYPRAHGRNVVNVILVDFRALDTLGEITVFAIAGVGAFALLQQRKRRPRS
ncbi:MAG: hydrogen gas-evolving membrane-bound hydrogenase subunit E, partial [Planctomycetota bacterium]